MAPVVPMLALAIAAQGSSLARLRGEARAEGQVIRLAEIADLPVGVAADTANLQVAVFPRGRDHVTLDGLRLAERIRGLAPGLKFEAGAERTIEVRRAPGAPTKAAVAHCATLARPIAAGEALSGHDLAAGDCGSDRAPRPYRYDMAARVVRATRDLDSGDLITSPPEFAIAAFPAGQAIALETVVGPVHVSRTVRTMRPGLPGRPILVRADSGPGFSAPFPGTAP